jgi:hypothetical protein
VAKKKKPPVQFPSIEQTQPPGLLAPDQDVAEWAARCVAEDQARLERLCKHYGIPPGPAQWQLLALAMAREFYREPPTSEGKLKWSPLVDGVLVVEIERLVQPANRKRTATHAARLLAERPPWRDFLARADADPEDPDDAPGNPAESLRRRYSRVRHGKKMQMYRDAFAYHELKQTVPEWNARVADILRDARRR